MKFTEGTKFSAATDGNVDEIESRAVASETRLLSFLVALVNFVIVVSGDSLADLGPGGWAEKVKLRNEPNLDYSEIRLWNADLTANGKRRMAELHGCVVMAVCLTWWEVRQENDPREDNCGFFGEKGDFLGWHVGGNSAIMV